MKLVTQGEMDMTFGVSHQPPQQSCGPIFTSPVQRKPATASVGVFFVFLFAMFGFMAWRMTSFSPRTKSSRTAAAAPIKPVARGVFSAPLTDADVELVRTLHPQAHA